MIRNPHYAPHKEAMSLAGRGEFLSVSDCRECGHAIAWATSKKSGKKYPCNVQPAQRASGSDHDTLRAAPWDVHTKEACQKNKDQDAQLTAWVQA